MRVTDYLIVIPDLVFMIVIADVWGASLFHVIMVIGILEWTTTARIIRAQVMSLRERVYVKRTRALGAGHLRIIWKHILPQVGPLLMANTVLTIAIAIYLETALAFLGLEDPDRHHLGDDPGARVRADRDQLRRLVGHRAGRHRHRRADRRLLPVRPGDRGRAQPAAAGSPPVGAPVAAAPTGRKGAGRDLTACSKCATCTSGSTCHGGRACTRVPGVSFALDAGERFGLVGESGCGKTTTVLALMGLLPPTATLAGEVLLNGAASWPAARSRCGRTAGPTSRWSSRAR